MSEYRNARRAGKTNPGLIEMREKNDPKFSVEIAPGYKVKFNNDGRANRSDRRRRGWYRGATPGAAYRKVRSLQTLGLHPGQQAILKLIEALAKVGSEVQ